MRTKLADRQLPNYTKGEELFNMISHIVGGVFGIVALVLCVAKAVYTHNVYGVVGSAVYGASLILLYIMSSVYHGLPNGLAKKVMQILDHCTIYLLIAGTYTPITLTVLRELNPTVGWAMFGIEWGFAVIAITLTAIDLKKYAVFSMACYIGMGWGIVFFWKETYLALTPWGFSFLLIGGIFYTIGAIVYGIGKRIKYMHCVFHVFVLLGSIAHFVAIFVYAL